MRRRTELFSKRSLSKSLRAVQSPPWRCVQIRYEDFINLNKMTEDTPWRNKAGIWIKDMCVNVWMVFTEWWRVNLLKQSFLYLEITGNKTICLVHRWSSLERFHSCFSGVGDCQLKVTVFQGFFQNNCNKQQQSWRTTFICCTKIDCCVSLNKTDFFYWKYRKLNYNMKYPQWRKYQRIISFMSEIKAEVRLYLWYHVRLLLLLSWLLLHHHNLIQKQKKDNHRNSMEIKRKKRRKRKWQYFSKAPWWCGPLTPTVSFMQNTKVTGLRIHWTRTWHDHGCHKRISPLCIHIILKTTPHFFKQLNWSYFNGP